ncbi:MAG: PAS domain S-box protein [Methylobacteriaceae bacterium]|nr:PAS domain S-box protein [Methylobacteriaceae bacterium]
MGLNKLAAPSRLGAISSIRGDVREISGVPDEDRQRFAAAYEHVGMGVAEVDADGRLLRVNAHLQRLLGRSSEELVGQSIFDPSLAENVEADRAQFMRQVRGEIHHYTTEKAFQLPDGCKLWIFITSSSVRDATGRFLYAVRVQHDITDRKNAEGALVRYADAQAALYDFTEGLQHLAELDGICSKALAAISRALRCSRSSILLFDDSGVMRFVASQGLSDAYRQAVEGHSPWPRDARNPEPITIENIETASFSEDLKQTVLGEGISSLAFIPIVADGRLLGKFMTYYDAPHAFIESENHLALTIARQLGLAIDRMNAEASRQRAERAAQQLVAIVESSDDAIVSKDLNGIIATWNRGAERLFGYTAEEVVGKPITIIIPPDRLDEEPEILARIRRGERVDHFETIRRRKDGTLVEISLTISPVRDRRGRIVGASKIARDISERREADRKLRQSERRLQDLLAAIPAAIYTTDAEGKITYYNEKAVEFAGRRPTLGSDEWCVTWKLYWPDGTPLPHAECPMALALREGRPIRDAEAVAERPDGTRVPFIPYPTPLRDEEGTIVGAINMLVDITERKQAETQQRILFKELNHRVKNNMQMLQSLLHLAGTQTRSEEARRTLTDASNRIAAMAAAQQTLYGAANATRFSARHFLETVSNTVRQTFSGNVQIVLGAGNAELSNDIAMPLALILNELLTNAVKHASNGSGEAKVRVGLEQRERSYVLYVEDDGPGFDLKEVRGRSSGLRLVEGLSRQLCGELKVTTGEHTRCSVQFPGASQ